MKLYEECEEENPGSGQSSVAISWEAIPAPAEWQSETLSLKFCINLGAVVGQLGLIFLLFKWNSVIHALLTLWHCYNIKVKKGMV